MNAPHVQAIPLSHVAIVHRTSDGEEQERADGRELAALLFGIRPEDRASLFEASDIGTEMQGLADVVAAVAEHDDTPSHVTSALYIVELELRSLIPRIRASRIPTRRRLTSTPSRSRRR